MASEGLGGAEPELRGIALYLLAFALLCWWILAVGNAPVPILHDMVEAYVWGQEFQLGYNQHPPFWAWLCGAWFTVWPRTVWGFAALDALNAGVGLAGAWALIGDFARGDRRVAAFALLLLTPVYTLGAYKYDANTIFLSVWPWATHAFVRALRTRGLGWAVAFGALSGVALLCKYYAALLILNCALAALATGEGRAYLRSASPWVSAAVAALLFAPHAVWLLNTGAPPLRYFGSASGLGFAVVWRSQLASAGQVSLWFILPSAVVLYFRRHAAGGRPARDPEKSLMLAILGLGPLALTFASAAALGVRLTPEMPIGGLALVPLLLIDAFGPADPRQLARFARVAAVAAVLAMAALAPVVMAARAYVGKNAAGVAPYPEVAAEATRLWRERQHSPLPYVAGYEYAHYLAFYSPDRPHALFKFSLPENLWVRRDDMTRRGFVAVCAETDAECLARAAALAGPAAERVSISVSRRFLGHLADPRRIAVFIIPPGAAP